MCGKADPNMTFGEYFAAAGVDMADNDWKPDPSSPVKLFTPMSMVPILHVRHDGSGKRAIREMRWGWINPRGSADPARSMPIFHARSETIDEKSMWAESFRTSRGVMITRFFNIGEEISVKKTKQWVCARPDEKEVFIAVVYAHWQHRVHGDLFTFAMVTAPASKTITDRVSGEDVRMPAILQGPDELKMWLGETWAPDEEVKRLLRTYEGPLSIWEQPPSEKELEKARAKAARDAAKAKKKDDTQPGLF